MFRKRLYPATLVVLALVIALVSIGITSEPQVVYASEVCETYEFFWSREPQLYADGYPQARTTTEADGKTLPPGIYDITAKVEDNHGNQMQSKEQAFLFDKVTPDIPDDPNADPSVWRTETYHLGKVTLTEAIDSVTVSHAFAGQDIGPQSLSVTYVKLVRCYDELVETVTGDCEVGDYGINNTTPYRVDVTNGMFVVKDELGTTTYPFSLSVDGGKKGSVSIPWTKTPVGKTVVTATWTRSWDEPGSYNSGELNCGGLEYTAYANTTCEVASAEVNTTIPGTMKWKYSLNGQVVNSGSRHITSNDSEEYAWNLSDGVYDLRAEVVFVPDNPKLESAKDIDEQLGKDCGSEPPKERVPACSNVWAWRYNGTPFTNGDLISPWGEPLDVVVKTNQNTQATQIRDLSTNDPVTDKVKPDKETGKASFHIEKFRPNRTYGIYISGFGHSMNAAPDCILYAGAWSGGMTSSLEGAGHDSLTLKGHTVRFGNGVAMNQAYWLDNRIAGLHLNALINNEVVSMPGSVLLETDIGSHIMLNVAGVTRIYRVSSKFSDIPQQGDGSSRLLEIAEQHSLTLITCQPFSWDKNLGRYTLFTGVTLTEVRNPIIAQ
jgi:hypothetical protein